MSYTQYGELMDNVGGKRGVTLFICLSVKDIYNFCAKINIKKTQEILLQGVTSSDVAYNLFLNVITQKYASSMYPITQINDKQVYKYNGFFEVENEIAVNIENEILQLASFLAFKTKDQKNEVLTHINCTMYRVESLKQTLFYRLIDTELKKRLNTKIFVGLTYKNNILFLKEKLKDYNPLVLDGSSSVHQRNIIIEKFQSSSLENRLLISNIQICNTGIDLDDKFGNRPRIVFLNPNYKVCKNRLNREYFDLVSEFMH